jgi:predicted DNA-binding protein YlxM (UPF0122 family)
MKFTDFLKQQKPICTKFPLYFAFSYDKYVELRNRCIFEFGEDLFGKLCIKREICGTRCSGRPIPKYPELAEYIAQLPNVKEGYYKGIPVWEVYATTCETCVFKSNCSKVCGTMEDFLNKRVGEHEPDEDRLSNIDDLSELDLNSIIEDSQQEPLILNIDYVDVKVPWFCLSKVQKLVIQLKTYTNYDFMEIGSKLNISKQAAHKAYVSGVSKLKEFASAQRYLNKNNNINNFNILKFYYIDGFSIDEISKLTNISTRNCSKIVNLFKKVNNF